MASEGVRVAILGIAQDGGVPQAGCNCERCLEAQRDPALRLYPSSIAIQGKEGGLHLIEATRDISQQIWMAATSFGNDIVSIPRTLCITHSHLGHIDGLGQFGKEAMGVDSIPLLVSSKVRNVVHSRDLGSPFDVKIVESGSPVVPSERCGFDYTLVPVPHRDEHSDTHAILNRGPARTMLFLPDHDSWGQTLGHYGAKDVKGWLRSLGVGIALIDGTFWDGDELPGRDMSQVPHPLVSETLEMIGCREEGDPEIYFIHLNHTNPLIDKGSVQSTQVEEMGWGVARQSCVFEL